MIEKIHSSQFQEKIMVGKIKHPDVKPIPSILKSLLKYMKISPVDAHQAIDEAVIGDSVGIHDKSIREVVENMNHRYEMSCDLPPTHAMILAGSTANIDRISHLKNGSETQEKINRAFEDAVIECKELEGKNRGETIAIVEKIINEEDSRQLPTSISTKAEVIGFLLRTFKQPGGRIQITGKQLGEWIEKVFEYDEEKGGGAAFQVADFISGIGEDNVTLHSLFRSAEQIRTLKHKPDLLVIDDYRINILRKKDASRAGDPTKINQIIELPADISVEFNGKKITAKNEADRCIFLSQNYNADGKIISLDPVLQFTDKELEAIGDKFEFFFTTVPTYLQRYEGNEYNQYAMILSNQFKILKNKGVKILYEFSGNPSKNVRFLKDVLKGNISSFSLNNQELGQLVEAIIIDDHLQIKVEKGNDPLTVYNNAMILAKYLEVDRLHVHDHNLDISIRKNATEEDMKREQSAVMHAKQRVIEWIRGKISVEKTPKKEQSSKLLKREGFIHFIKFSEELAQQIYPDYNENTYMNRARLKHELRNNGYCKVDDEYSVSVVPTKWIYDEALVTTSSGDIIAIVAAIHALYKKSQR